jgi:hypothetical protein
MSKNRTGLYAALAVAGAGGYYLYRAGGDPKLAKEEMKCTSFIPGFPLIISHRECEADHLYVDDANVARHKIPADKAERAGEKVGSEAGAHIDEAV